MIEIKKNTSAVSDIETHLMEVADSFVPNLSSYVDIKQYAVKLFEKAQRLEAWENNRLVGLLAYYQNFNDMSAFITNVSIENGFMGGGLATEMINKMVDAVRGTLGVIRLEVNKGNERALRFYLKNGFVEKGTKDNHTVILEKNVVEGLL